MSGRHSLLKRIYWFVAAFLLTLLMQFGISSYQAQYVLLPLEERTDNIQAISQFLNTADGFLSLLEQFRWDYGDSSLLAQNLLAQKQLSDDALASVHSELSQVSEEQYLLAGAARTTYAYMMGSTNRLLDFLASGDTGSASELYYSTVLPCGTYVLKYSKDLLEQAILDNQSAYRDIVTLSNTLRTLQLLTVVLCLSMGLPLGFSVRSLFQSVDSLSSASRSISNGDLDTPDLYAGEDNEIGDMTRAFNEMKHSMKRQVALLEERNEMEQQMLRWENKTLEMQSLMERSQLQLLRSQIDPHFLFNTLNVIMYTARQESAEKTRQMLEALSRLFRYSLGSNEVQVPLAQEIHIINSFFTLYRARFGERVALKWQISPDVDVTTTMIPSFLLQPLVENAFKHGLAPKEESGAVTIRMAAEGEILKIEVEDNGVGISQKILEMLQERMNVREIPSAHIGVLNVFNRIRLLGSAYGLTIDSKPGRGTLVRLQLPLIVKEEENYDDQNDDNG